MPEDKKKLTVSLFGKQITDIIAEATPQELETLFVNIAHLYNYEWDEKWKYHRFEDLFNKREKVLERQLNVARGAHQKFKDGVIDALVPAIERIGKRPLRKACGRPHMTCDLIEGHTGSHESRDMEGEIIRMWRNDGSEV